MRRVAMGSILLAAVVFSTTWEHREQSKVGNRLSPFFTFKCSYGNTTS
jgi:hypothetical protein